MSALRSSIGSRMASYMVMTWGHICEEVLVGCRWSEARWESWGGGVAWGGMRSRWIVNTGRM